MSAHDMETAAFAYLDLGYPPVPLTPTAEEPKGRPPKGRTGYGGVNMHRAELADVNWSRKRLALRLPVDVVGMDVDTYNGGAGGLAELERKYGRLPATVMSHNGRPEVDGVRSGIRLFRVPARTTLKTDPATGVDMVQWFHRYVIAAPSTHPSGRAYAWWDEADECSADMPPEPGDLPELPWKWIEGLAAAKGKKASQAASQDEVRAFLAKHVDAKRPKALQAVEAKLAAAKTGHDTALTVACWAFREAAAGWYPAQKALDVLEAWWTRHFRGKERTPGAGELASIVLWAVAEVQADTDRVTELAEEADQPERTVRDLLLGLVGEQYRVGRSDDDRAFLAANTGPNMALFSGAAKAELAHRVHKAHGIIPPRAALDETWMAIEGEALDVAKETLPLRIAWHDGAVVVDLADTTGRAILVDRTGWRVVDRSPVTFRRSKAMLPLDIPVRGGTVDELFELVNVGNDHRQLFVAWLVSTLFENLPHPLAVLRGQQGAAKTTTARNMTRLVDPCMASTQKPPKAEEDWSQTCTARWVVAVDNVSRVSDWWSDALCRAVTGDGWLRRQLYTDDEVVATSYRRCIVLNGITLGASLRPDLAERLVIFELERPTEWLTEREVDARLDDMRPRVLGALLDHAAATLAKLDDVDVPRDVRMADFAHMLAAYDAATGADTLTAYKQQVEDAFDEALEGDELAAAVVAFMRTQSYSWHGRASDLYSALDKYRPSGTGQGGRGEDATWPKSASHLVQSLNRSAPLLHRAGIKWHKPTRNKRGSVLYMTWTIDPEGAEGDGGDGDSPFVDTFGVDDMTRQGPGKAKQESGKQQQEGDGRHRRHHSHPPATEACDF